ncbi:MAG: YqgE/AlgH family protein [Bacteroidales bacterium]|nr:YqgE/AlgH family protein [Bacteroidales bacterium]
MSDPRDFLQVKQTEFSLSPGRILISVPLNQDLLFSRSVVLLTDYNDEAVAGVIVNKPTPFMLDRLVDGLTLNAPLHIGGPVSPEMLFLVHNYEHCRAASSLKPGIFFGYDERMLKLIEQRIDPTLRYRFLLGYSEWAPGQLEDEIAHNYWVVANPTPELLFQTETSQIWRKAIANLGREYEHWLKIPESPHLN